MYLQTSKEYFPSEGRHVGGGNFFKGGASVILLWLQLIVNDWLVRGYGVPLRFHNTGPQ